MARSSKRLGTPTIDETASILDKRLLSATVHAYRPRVGNLWPAGKNRPAEEIYRARGLFANFENFVANKIS